MCFFADLFAAAALPAQPSAQLYTAMKDGRGERKDELQTMWSSVPYEAGRK